jgi:hypothetical protein
LERSVIPSPPSPYSMGEHEKCDAQRHHDRLRGPRERKMPRL